MGLETTTSLPVETSLPTTSCDLFCHFVQIFFIGLVTEKKKTSIPGDNGVFVVFTTVRDAITAGFLSGVTVTVEDAEGNAATGVTSGTFGFVVLGKYPPGTLFRVTASRDGYANINSTYMIRSRDPYCQVRSCLQSVVG